MCIRHCTRYTVKLYEAHAPSNIPEPMRCDGIRKSMLVSQWVHHAHESNFVKNKIDHQLIIQFENLVRRFFPFLWWKAVPLVSTGVYTTFIYRRVCLYVVVDVDTMSKSCSRHIFMYLTKDTHTLILIWIQFETKCTWKKKVLWHPLLLYAITKL